MSSPFLVHIDIKFSCFQLVILDVQDFAGPWWRFAPLVKMPRPTFSATEIRYEHGEYFIDGLMANHGHVLGILVHWHIDENDSIVELDR
jgi:hypothetical protein